MITRKEAFIAIAGALALGASVRADMRPVSPLDAGPLQPPQTYVATSSRDTDLSDPLTCLSVTDLGSPPVKSLPSLHSRAWQADELPPAQIQSDGQNSFGLCLYALLGLGVCRSAALVKRLSFSHFPQWYHDGGPSQIGHCQAISPDCLCHALVCFVQPDSTADDPISQYRRQVIISLWRKSQCAPTVLASRGPPVLS